MLQPNIISPDMQLNAKLNVLIRKVYMIGISLFATGNKLILQNSVQKYDATPYPLP